MRCRSNADAFCTCPEDHDHSENSGALGYTMQVEQGDKYLLTKKELENKIATFTGGRAAEEVVFGEVTTGASNDIEQATKIARSMITRYGMSDDLTWWQWKR